MDIRHWVDGFVTSPRISEVDPFQSVRVAPRSISYRSLQHISVEFPARFGWLSIITSDLITKSIVGLARH